LEINEALGTAAAVHDFNNDNVVNLVDIQIVIDGVLNLGCSATPVITDFNPKTGTIGTLVTVTGRYLAATQISMPQAGGGMATQQPVTISATGVSFAVPITAATGPITISTLSSSATTTASFTVIPIPSGQTVIAGRAVNGGGGPIHHGSYRTRGNNFRARGLGCIRHHRQRWHIFHLRGPGGDGAG
jgi:hypothetical protein